LRDYLLFGLLFVSLAIPIGCSKGDDTQPPTAIATTPPKVTALPPLPTVEVVPAPSAEVLSTSTPATPDVPIPTKTTVKSTATAAVEKTTVPVGPVLLSLIDLPDILTGVDGCEPRPRFSKGPSGGTVPWPTPTPSAAGSKALEIAEIELAVFRGVAARVISDAYRWTDQVAVDLVSVESAQDINELGWALARVAAPWCDAMSLAPWPQQYESSTTPVADFLVDLSVWARQARTEADPSTISVYTARLDDLVTRVSELKTSFSDIEILPVTTGSSTLGFFLPAPEGWHVVKIGLDLRMIANYETQVAILRSTDERDDLPLAGLRMRMLRRVPGSDINQWTKNGELFFPGYVADTQADEGSITLSIDIEGLRAKVEILAVDERIYYVQTICPATDATCIEFAEKLSTVAEYR